MTKAERFEDIGYRNMMTMAERIFTRPGSEGYNILTNIIQNIREEYKEAAESNKWQRHGFRLYGGKYHEVILSAH